MKPTNDKVNRIISMVLVVSSGVSMLLMAAGLGLFLVKQEPVFSGARAVGLTEALTGALHLEPLALMALGIIILISTPFLRVIGVFFSFWFIEKDKVYALISLGVLAILTVSLFVPGIK